MQAMSDGLDLDPNIVVAVQNNTIAQQAVRIAMLEAAVQQQTNTVAQLQAQIPSDTEVTEDASAI